MDMQSGRLIQADLDRRFKETGVENVVSSDADPGKHCLEKEADHIEGFAPEVAWVTHGGMERLQERFCIRPTSETLFCDLWARTVQSYRDLAEGMESVEFRASLGEDDKTVPSFQRILVAGRTYAFMQHTKKQKKEPSRCGMYMKTFTERRWQFRSVSGRKAEHEKFAGAQDTYTIEALMHDGKALQVCNQPFLRKWIPGCI